MTSQLATCGDDSNVMNKGLCLELKTEQHERLQLGNEVPLVKQPGPAIRNWSVGEDSRAGDSPTERRTPLDEKL